MSACFSEAFLKFSFIGFDLSYLFDYLAQSLSLYSISFSHGAKFYICPILRLAEFFLTVVLIWAGFFLRSLAVSSLVALYLNTILPKLR